MSVLEEQIHAALAALPQRVKAPSGSSTGRLETEWTATAERYLTLRKTASRLGLKHGVPRAVADSWSWPERAAAVADVRSGGLLGGYTFLGRA